MSKERWVGPAMDRAKRRLKKSRPPADRETRTFARRKARREGAAKIRAAITELKGRPCQDCGGSFPPECMDFDHRPGEEKWHNVASLANYSVKRVLIEIAKCDLVCANCHRIRTKSRGWPRSPRIENPVDVLQMSLFGEEPDV